MADTHIIYAAPRVYVVVAIVNFTWATASRTMTRAVDEIFTAAPSAELKVYTM